MSVRSAKAPLQAVIPQPGVSVRGPQAQPQKEPARPGARQAAPQSGGAAGKALAKPLDRASLERLQGGAVRPAPHGHGLPAKEAPPVAPELAQQPKTTAQELSPAGSPASNGRAKLRAIVMDRILQGVKDVQNRLVTFAQDPGDLGVVNLSLTLSESSLTYLLWKEPSTMPARRAGLVSLLGLPRSTNDASIVREVMGEVHQAVEAFQASKPGTEALQQYEEVLQHYEEMKVLPIVPGHDSGPIMDELKRLGIAHEKAFTRSLLVNPRVLAVGLSPDEGSATQVMIAGLTVAQLGTVVAHMRSFNPLLTNQQVCQLLFLATADRKKGGRKALGEPDLKNVQELARQLLRLRAAERIFI